MRLKRLRQKGHAYYYDAGGKPRRWIALGSNAVVAMRKYEALMQHRPLAGTVAEIVTAYMTSLMAKGRVRDSSLAVYAQYQRRLINVFGEMAADQLTPKHVARYLDLSKRASRDNEIGLLRCAYAYAMKTVDGIDANPCIGIKSERDAPKEKRYITDKELEAVIERGRPLLGIAAELAYATALRISDVLKLRWDDFSEDAAIVQTKTRGKAPRQRYILTPELRDLLDRARAIQGVRSVYVIATRGGQPVKHDTMRTWWRDACEAAGVESARFHDIRRKAATDRDAEAGGDLTAAQKLLGHATPAATKGYIAGLKINTVEPLKRRKR